MNKKCLLFLLLSLSLSAKTVFIYTSPDHLFSDYRPSPQESNKVYYILREELEKAGYQVEVLYTDSNIDNAVALITINDNIYSSPLAACPREKRLHCIFESPVVLPVFYDRNLTKVFGKTFIMLDDYVDNKNYFKLHYPQPRLEMLPNIPDFEQKKLCAMVASNKNFNHPKALYRERVKSIRYFQKYQWEFDLYGPWWDGFFGWRGTIENKWETLKNYKFSICYENMRAQRGYITEKIFDSFVAGCVPIYWGADNIADYIPADCFIDRRAFSSEEELYQFIRHMEREPYEKHLEAIRTYLKSPEAHLFSVDHFVKMMVEEVQRLDH